VPLVEVMELLVPCILHLENIVGETVLSTIIEKGIDLHDTSPKEDFITHLLRTFQTEVFGTPDPPLQCQLRYKKENGTFSLEAIQR
jgi:hypothetical protein